MATTSNRSRNRSQQNEREMRLVSDRNRHDQEDMRYGDRDYRAGRNEDYDDNYEAGASRRMSQRNDDRYYGGSEYGDRSQGRRSMSDHNWDDRGDQHRYGQRDRSSGFERGYQGYSESERGNYRGDSYGQSRGHYGEGYGQGQSGYGRGNEERGSYGRFARDDERYQGYGGQQSQSRYGAYANDDDDLGGRSSRNAYARGHEDDEYGYRQERSYGGRGRGYEESPRAFREENDGHSARSTRERDEHGRFVSEDEDDDRSTRSASSRSSGTRSGGTASKRGSAAARSSGTTTRSAKTKGQGRGWHGDPEGHARAGSHSHDND